jgi:2-C-methyl-D-erythritol 4-phosphate cytidylyltransferase
MNAAIIVAAGKSERMGSNVDKAFLHLATKPVLAYSLLAFEACPDIDEVVIVVRKDRIDSARGMAQMFGCSKVRKVVAGGVLRQDSVVKGLESLNPESTIVAIHDGARPCVTPSLISETVQTAAKHGAAVAATKITDTVKYVEKGVTVTRTLDRSKIWTVQTPQTFSVALLRKAYDEVRKKKMVVTDDASAAELVTKTIHLVPATVPNIKITTVEDLPVVAVLLERMETLTR